MAKPIPPHRARCSTSSTRLEHNTTSPRPRRKAPSPSPSSALLALLSTISASVTSVHASPAPPSFLCPPFLPDPTPTLNVRARRNPSPGRRRAQWTKRSDEPRHVPDKFELGDNGRWQRVDTYTLYGSTVCLTCKDDATTSATSFDDQIQSPASSSVPITTTSSTATYNISLPPGWKEPVESGNSHTTLILALSLVLAFIICFLIIGCLFWRKMKRRKRRQSHDIEGKARRRRKQNVDEEDRVSMLFEREVKVKKKIWARATARWKANAKYTARQRRGKRIVSTRANSPRISCASLDRIEDTGAAPTHISPLPPSPISRRSSLESMYADTEAGAGIVSLPEERVDATSEMPPSPSPPSPPAYHNDTTVLRTSASAHGDSGVTFHGPSQTCSNAGSSSYDAPNQSNLASHSVHVAHVATDDKALLARMADLVSAPPLDATADSLHNDAADYHISAPLWQDEELEDFGDESHQPVHRDLTPLRPSIDAVSPARLFPSPPSKGKLAAPDFYDYPYTFDDILVEPVSGPSAPPFEEDPQHTSDVTRLAPSAPSLSEAEPTYYYNDAHPSAPAHDQEAFSTQADLTHPPNQDTIPPHDDTSPNSRLPESFTESFTDGSNALVQGPVASDGTPPCYYP